MKRKIKFKCYNPITKKIYDVNYINFWDNSLSYIDENNKTIIEFIENISLINFTNLKDINGTEIYEGDIVKFEDCYFDQKDNFYNIGVVQRERNTNELAIGQLLYQKTDFDENYIDYIEQNFEVCEVIGNIYQNPELLKK